MRIVYDKNKMDRDTSVEVQQVTTDKFYGVVITKGLPINSKAFITRQLYCEANFKVAALEGLTHGNTYSNYQSQSLVSLIESIISSGDLVLEFNTYQELFSWLIQ